MRKATFRLLMLAVAMTLGLASCNNAEDNPVVMNPLAKQVKGMWWAMYPAEGTTTGGKAYTHVGQALNLNDDGTGYAATFYFDDETEDPIEVRGGKSIVPFTYTTDWDGNIRLTFNNGYQADADYYATWTLRLDAGRISLTSPTDACLMEPANVDEQYLIEKWDRAANGGNVGDAPYNELRINIENTGELYPMQKSFTLNKKIDQAVLSSADYLEKSGSVSLEFRVCPLYLQSANGSKAGDYYFVTCAVTPHNNSFWGPEKHNHGGTQIRIYGYWMKDLDLSVDLVNEDGSAIQGLSYFERPIPENQNDSRTYSNGKTISVSGTLSGGYSEKQGGNLGVSGSCGVSWTSTTSYSLNTVSYTLDTSSPTVKYHYYTSNVKLKDDWDNTEENFPTACHTEFTGHSCWVWFVPYDENGTSGVKDGSSKRFRLKASVKATYSSWYHWRGAAEYDSNRKDYDDVKFDTGDGYLLPQLDRTPWGIIALKNASSYEMAHVKFYKSGEESAEPVATLTNSFSKDQVAKQGLAEGTYTVIYDFMDPNTNQVLSRWKMQNVKVHQGRDEASATTSVSTVNAVKVE